MAARQAEHVTVVTPADVMAITCSWRSAGKNEVNSGDAWNRDSAPFAAHVMSACPSVVNSRQCVTCLQW